MQPYGKYIILAGIVIVLIGIAVYFFGNKLNWFGNLPGDIKIEGEKGRFYFPVVTCIIVSVVLSLIFWLIRKFG
jgi:hypothetical protein